MATKKQLEERIAALEVEIALLRTRVGQQTIRVLPAPSDVPWPGQYYPYRFPQVWCGANTSPSLKGSFSFNAAAS